MKETVDQYLKLKYTIQLIENDDSTFFVKVLELPGCMSEGDTVQEAYEMIKDAMRAWITTAIENNMEIPLPNTIKDEFSGKFILRIPKSLHRDLSLESNKENVSLNTYIIHLLSQNNPKNAILSRINDLFGTCFGIIGQLQQFVNSLRTNIEKETEESPENFYNPPINPQIHFANMLTGTKDVN